MRFTAIILTVFLMLLSSVSAFAQEERPASYGFTNTSYAARPLIKAPETSGSKPQILLGSYSVLEAPVLAGDDFTLVFTLKNASQSYNISNLKIVARSDGGVFIPQYGTTNQFYIQSLPAQQEEEITYSLKAASEKSGDYELNLFLEYENDLGQMFTETIMLWLPISNSASIEIDSLVVPGRAEIGNKVPVSVRFTNTSSEDIANVKLVIEGDIEGEKVEFAMGELRAGKTNFVDHKIVFTDTGEKILNVYFICTYKNNHVYEADPIEVAVSVEDNSLQTGITGANDSAGLTYTWRGPNKTTFFISFFLAGFLIAVFIAYIVRKRR